MFLRAARRWTSAGKQAIRPLQWLAPENQELKQMACPFFMPTQKFEGGGWLHPSRLPLGAGWRGVCTASPFGQTVPTDDQVRECCNLGYASNCPRLPAQRAWDAVRFAVARDCKERIVLCYVCEMGHHPAEHGVLEYETGPSRWTLWHRDSRIQKMAECYLECYRERSRAGAAAATS
jgi:hypothetical protein